MDKSDILLSRIQNEANDLLYLSFADRLSIVGTGKFSNYLYGKADAYENTALWLQEVINDWKDGM